MRDGDASNGGQDVLVTAMDRLHAAVLDHRDAEVIASLLEDLARLCAVHFATEEKVLRRYGYRHVDARLAKHARLLKRIPDLRNRLRSGQRKGPGITNLLHNLSQQAGYRERSVA